MMRLHAPTIPFQHTAARRRLVEGLIGNIYDLKVSTHSRPKAAGLLLAIWLLIGIVSTHSRPKAAGSGMPHI